MSYSICLCPSSGCGRDGSQIINKTANISLGHFIEMVVFPGSGPQVIYRNGDICDG